MDGAISKYNYTETCFYAIIRSGTLTFERVPVDGSSKMPDDLMESIEPLFSAGCTVPDSIYGRIYG